MSLDPSVEPSDIGGTPAGADPIRVALVEALHTALDELRRLAPNTNHARIAARKALTLHEQDVLRRAYSLTPSELAEEAHRG